MDLKERKLFIGELFFSIVVITIASHISMSNILLASNDLFPSSVDFMGHMAKVEYIADSIMSGKVPSWYPYWYCGSTVTQYYPPLSYYLLVIPYILTKNPMITYKIYIISVQFFSAFGLWYLYRKYIGSWTGLIAAAIYCLQPYIIGTIIDQGQVAQGAIIIMTPWYFLFVVRLTRSHSRLDFFICSLFCVMMILSHPNSTFMLCICLLIALFIAVITKFISFKGFILYTFSIFFAGMITACWSIVGVLPFENPTIPYVIPEAAVLSSTKLEWFVGGWFMRFSLSSLVGAFVSILIHYFIKKKWYINSDNDFSILLFSLVMVISLVFSFGLAVPFFRYLPMAETMFAGRMLIFTSMMVAILSAYLIKILIDWGQKGSLFIQIVCLFTILGFVIIVFNEINPLRNEYVFWDLETQERAISLKNNRSNSFEVGRFTFIGSFPCGMAYFPIKFGFAINEGFNIEGTTHHKYFRNLIIANAAGAYDYIAKGLAYHNVRYVLSDEAFNPVGKLLVDSYAYKEVSAEDGNHYYISDTPSSYVMRDQRNALIIGPGARGIAVEFPYFVYEDRDDIYNFSIEELSRYKLIYISEPNLSTISKKNKTEEMIRKLLEGGTVVFVAPAPEQRHHLFGVVPQFYKSVQRGLLYKADNVSPEGGYNTAEYINADGAYFKGLDESYFALQHDNATMADTVIGAKNVEGGKVIFIGMNFSHHLKSVSILNWGLEKMSTIFADETYEKKEFFEDLFKEYRVEKDFYPDAFAVQNFRWDHRSAYFDYTSEDPEDVTVSITYAPRWRAYVDGKQINVGQRENFITLDLPQGNHSVKMVYGITKYGALGYGVSALFMVLFLLFMRNYERVVHCIEAGILQTKSELEI